MEAVTPLAFAGAATMGYAIQRGSTCLVAGVQEWVDRRDARRLLALAEGSLVAGALLVLAWWGFDHPAPVGGHAISWATLLGGMLLGFGAWVNGACVFGSVAAVGAGDWAYLAFPVGYFMGAVAAGPAIPVVAPSLLPFATLAPWLAGLAFVVSMAGFMGRSASPSGDAPGEWPPRRGIIAVCAASFLMTLAFGPWLYSETISAIARGRADFGDVRLLLYPCLLCGAVLGGWTRGKWNPRRPRLAGIVRCFFGGMVMALGAQWVPGANDGLLLSGLPTLRPEALVALPVMCGTVALCMAASRRLAWRTTD